MKVVSVTSLILGIGSIALNYCGCPFTALSPTLKWGGTVGWTISGVMIVGGAILYVADRRKKAGHAPQDRPMPAPQPEAMAAQQPMANA